MRGAQSLCSPSSCMLFKLPVLPARGPRTLQPMFTYADIMSMPVYAAAAHSCSCWLHPGMSQTFLLACLSVPECLCAMQETVVCLYMHEHQHHIYELFWHGCPCALCRLALSTSPLCLTAHPRRHEGFQSECFT
jgi:hypothetical protein